jgi:predicted adenylyl cyclase CyaB
VGVALASSLGVLVEVRKQRKLLLWQNVRIHLDQVEGLGSFIEFEAVLSDEAPESAGHEQLAYLCKHLSIQEKDHVSGSYADLAILQLGLSSHRALALHCDP